MKLTADRLPGQLAERLLPVYLVAGDEPLLVTEAMDAIRARARAQGFDEREQVYIDKSTAVWENAGGRDPHAVAVCQPPHPRDPHAERQAWPWRGRRC